MFADDDVKDDTVDDNIVDDSTVDDDKKPEETPEQELERLRNEKTSWEEKETKYVNEKTALGRRYKELQDGQAATQETIRTLSNTVQNLQQPKQPEEGYLDLSDPKVADDWFNRKVNARVTADNEAQKQYADQYDKDVMSMLEKQNLDAEEKEAILARLETQKENRFNEPALDAEHNISKARLGYLEEKVSTGSSKTLNLKRDKAVGVGVGGSGTIEASTRKTKADSPEIVRLKGFFEQEKKQRGY